MLCLATILLSEGVPVQQAARCQQFNRSFEKKVLLVEAIILRILQFTSVQNAFSSC